MTDKLIYVVKVSGGEYEDSYVSNIAAFTFEKDAKGMCTRLKKEQKKLENIYEKVLPAYCNAINNMSDSERIRRSNPKVEFKDTNKSQLEIGAYLIAKDIAIKLGANRNDLKKLGFGKDTFNQYFFEQYREFSYEKLELQ